MGGKGDSGGGHTPVVQNASLFSTQYAYVVDAITEGPIYGFPDPAWPEKYVKLNGVAIQNDDNTYNFDNVSITFRNGYLDQSYIPGFPIGASDISGSLGLPATVKKDSAPFTVVVNSSVADELQLRFSTPMLEKQETNGDLHGTILDFEVHIKGGKPGAVWIPIYTGHKDGLASSKYEWSTKVSLGPIGPGPWTVRVMRITPDSVDQTLYNELNFEGLALITNKKMSWPGVAHCATRCEAAKFGSVPNRSFHLKGLIIKVPDNYTPAEYNCKTGLWTPAKYEGDWHGKFKLCWTSNPAWCLYDILTNRRYGIGKWVEEAWVDKWGFFECAQYCDEMVPSGRFTDTGELIMEPRFVLNCYIQTQDEAARVVQMIASNFRAMAYWASGAVFLAQDKPMDPSVVFTPTETISGDFEYTSTSRRARHNSIEVSWNDPAKQCKLVPEPYEMSDVIRREGFRFPTTKTSFGCLSRGQAKRDGRWVVITEQEETEVVTLTTGMKGAAVRPGEVVAVMDPKKTGKNDHHGRVLSQEGATLQLDRPVVLAPGVQHHIVVTTTDGSPRECRILNQPTPSSVMVDWIDITVPPLAVFIIVSNQVYPRLFRVFNKKKGSKSGEYTIQGTLHCPWKFDWIETGLITLDPADWLGSGSNPINNMKPPQGLILKEFLYPENNDYKVGVKAQWSPGSADQGVFACSYKIDSDNWITLPDVTGYNVDIRPVKAPCDFQFAVVARLKSGSSTRPLEGALRVLGKTKEPETVTGFSVVLDGPNLVFSWNDVSDLDKAGYYLKEGETWAGSGAFLMEGFNGTKFVTELGHTRDTTFLIKAKDTSGLWSKNAASCSLKVLAWDDSDVLTPPEKIALKLDITKILKSQTTLNAKCQSLGGLTPGSDLKINLDAYNQGIADIFAFLELHPTPTAWNDFSGSTWLGEGGGVQLHILVAAIDELQLMVEWAVNYAQVLEQIASGATDAMVKNEFIDATTGLVKWDKLHFAARSILAEQLTIADPTNLFPNGNSEVEAPSNGWPPTAVEGMYVSTSAGPNAGTACRYVPQGQALSTSVIPCGPGDAYIFRAYVGETGGRLEIKYNGIVAASIDAVSDGYALLECSTPEGAPDGTSRVEFVCRATTKATRFDNIIARPMLKGDVIIDGNLKASLALLGELRVGFQASQAGFAKFGVKMTGKAGQAPLQIGIGGMTFGPDGYKVDDVTLRPLLLLEGKPTSSNSRFHGFYRGNSLGPPDARNFFIVPKWAKYNADMNMTLMEWDLCIIPTNQVGENLDGLRHAHFEIYDPVTNLVNSGYGVQSCAWDVTLSDRIYSASVDTKTYAGLLNQHGGSANNGDLNMTCLTVSKWVHGNWTLVDLGGGNTQTFSSPRVKLFVRYFNAYGSAGGSCATYTPLNDPNGGMFEYSYKWMAQSVGVTPSGASFGGQSTIPYNASDTFDSWSWKARNGLPW